MVSLDQYQAYRKAAKELNHQLMDALVERPVLMRTARAFDIARGNTFVFESEAEMNVLMDYALYEYRRQGQSLVQRYREQTTSLSPMQRELLDGMCQAYTSLFRITAVQAAESNFPRLARSATSRYAARNKPIAATLALPVRTMLNTTAVRTVPMHKARELLANAAKSP